MNYQEFIKKVMEQIIPRLSTDEKIEMKTTIKNNNTIFRGILFQNSKSNFCTVIYLEPFYVSYQEGDSLERIVDEILTELQTHHPQSNIDMSFFVILKRRRNILFIGLSITK